MDYLGESIPYNYVLNVERVTFIGQDITKEKIYILRK